MNIKKRIGYGLIIALALQAAAPVHAGIWSSISDWFSGFSSQSKNTVYVVSAAIVACCGAFGLWRLLSKKPSQPNPARAPQQGDAPVQPPIQVRVEPPIMYGGAASFLDPAFNPAQFSPKIPENPMPVIPPMSQAESKRSADGQVERPAQSAVPAAVDTGYGLGLALDLMAHNISSAASSASSALAAGGRMAYEHLPTQEQLKTASSVAIDGAARAGSAVVSAAQTATPVVQDAAVRVGNGSVAVVRALGRGAAALYARLAKSPDSNTPFEQYKNAVTQLITHKKELITKAEAIQNLSSGLLDRYDTATANALKKQLDELNAQLTPLYSQQKLKEWGQSLIRRYEQGYPEAAKASCEPFVQRVREKCSIAGVDGQRIPIDEFELYGLLGLAGLHSLGSKELEESLSMASRRPVGDYREPELLAKDIDIFKKLLSNHQLYNPASIEELGAYIRDSQQEPASQDLQKLYRYGKDDGDRESADIRQWLSDMDELVDAYGKARNQFNAAQKRGDKFLTSLAQQQGKNEKRPEIKEAKPTSVRTELPLITPVRVSADREHKWPESRESKRPESKRGAHLVAQAN